MADPAFVADRFSTAHPGSASALVAAGTVDTAERVALTERIAACRRSFLAQAEPRRTGSLQIVDLSRLRQRLGARWPELRERVAAVVDSTLGRSLGPNDLCLRAGDDRRYVLRVGADRRELERQGELIAADATSRLCGAIPGGAAVRVSTLPFDLDAGLDGVGSVAELRRQVEALGPEHGDGLDIGSFATRHMQPLFRPILNLRKRLVSAYQLAAPTGASLDRIGPAQLDEWTLTQATALLAATRRNSEPALVLPIAYATLAAMRSREPFMRLCRRLPPYSARRLIFEVVDLPPGLPQARVRDLIAYLRPFCLTVVVRLPALPSDFAHLAASGVGGVSVAAAELPVDDQAIAAALGTLADRARTLDMRSMLVGANSVKLCRGALAAGIGHLSGDALMPPLTQPGRAFLISR